MHREAWLDAVELVVFGIRCMLGLVFIVAGLTKLSHWREFRATVLRYELVAPRLARMAGVLLPPLELVLGTALLAGFATRTSALLVSGMLAMFTLAVAITLMRGRVIECGCFSGVAPRRMTWSTVVRNLVLLSMALSLTAAPETTFSLDAALLGAEGTSIRGTDGVAVLLTCAILLLVWSIISAMVSVRRLSITNAHVLGERR